MSNFFNPSATRPTGDRMWPLDACIIGLTGLVMTLVAGRLSFTDERWWHNAWTYVVAIPVVAILADMVLRRIASQYVQKSLQIGFLFSVSLHLLLLMLATGVLIFRQYSPQSLIGADSKRSPVSRTVPEYLFASPTKNTTTRPDWSKPTETETGLPIDPRQERLSSQLAGAASQLRTPQPSEPAGGQDLSPPTPRQQSPDSVPMPLDLPSKIAKKSPTRPATPPASSPPALSLLTLPRFTPTDPVQLQPSQLQPRQLQPRPFAELATQKQPALQTTIRSGSPLPSPAGMIDSVPPSAVGGLATALPQRSPSPLPSVGNFAVTRSQSKPMPVRGNPAPAAASPGPQSVPKARPSPQADRVIAKVNLAPLQRSRPISARGVAGDLPDASGVVNPAADLARQSTVLERSAAAAGLPNVDSGDANNRVRRPSDAFFATGVPPAGLPSLESVASGSRQPSRVSDLPTAVPAIDITGSAWQPRRRSVASVPPSIMQSGPPRSSSPRPSSPRPNSARPESPRFESMSPAWRFDVAAASATGGLANPDRKRSALASSDALPRIAGLNLNVAPRPRQDLGGPVTPVGPKPAAVESFDRRIRRTKGGQTPSTAVGPETEEAIERGLAYLESVQNEDGSWSLQGKGEKVILQSDTAATGLCLLAFQGAGYTHRQHQYADTIAKGLRFLIDNQRTNGDLYRRENRVSDGNVAFYSHGIAALAMSEAYGMTQDPQLKVPAQAALDYIGATQHRTRGGWRYTPQISADTSVTGWMMMALKSGQLSGLQVPGKTYRGIDRWLRVAQSPDRRDRYRYDPYAPDTPSQRHGRKPTPTMTSVGMLMRMYAGWRRDTPEMKSAADYLLRYPPKIGTPQSPQRDAYYWYYATQVMFHMGGDYWQRWNRDLNPVLLGSQVKAGPQLGSWHPDLPVRDRWSVHAGRLYVTTMNLLNLEVYYRHLPIYDDTAQ